jgi:putative DNA primase/helicase
VTDEVGLDSGQVMRDCLTEQGVDVEKEEAKTKSRPTNATKLVALAEAKGVELFKSGAVAYASYVVGGHMETSRIERGGSFAGYLQQMWYEEFSSGVGGEAMSTALETLGARGKFGGVSHPVALRVGWHEATCYLALADAERRVVKVTAEGWDVIAASESPVRFCLGPGASALPEPRRNGDLELLRAYANCDDSGFTLIKGFLVSCFLEAGTFPLLAVAGQHGTGKSVLCAHVRMLIDPVQVCKRRVPKAEDALAATVANNFIVLIDNCSGLPQWLSDALCGLATGSGFVVRQLYSDSTEHVVEARAPIILNGIDDIAGKRDLADRSLLVRLEPFEVGSQRSESALGAQFLQDRPEILGGLLDRVSRAIRDMPADDWVQGLRLIDATQFVSAGEPEAEREEFLQAYRSNRAEQYVASVEGDAVFEAIKALVEKEGALDRIGATELLARLNTYEGHGVEGRRAPEGWPKQANVLSGLLTRIGRDAFRANGFEYVETNRTGNARKRFSISTLPATEGNGPSSPSPSGFHAPNTLEGPVRSGDGDSVGDRQASSQSVIAVCESSPAEGTSDGEVPNPDLLGTRMSEFSQAADDGDDGDDGIHLLVRSGMDSGSSLFDDEEGEAVAQRGRV